MVVAYNLQIPLLPALSSNSLLLFLYMKTTNSYGITHNIRFMRYRHFENGQRERR